MLYENVTRLCKEKGVSIAKLERECGLGNATVQGWKELRDAPRFSTLMKVAGFFGVSVDELMMEQEREKND